MVYPAAGLIDYYQGKRLVLINKDKTARDSMADLVINEKIGEVLGAAVEDNTRNYRKAGANVCISLVRADMRR